MLQPVQKDHELVCPGCGCVLDTISDTQSKQSPLTTANQFLLGSAVQSNIKWHFDRDKYQRTYERALYRLTGICQEFNLPERVAIEAMNRIRKKEKGLFSFREQVKQLLHVLNIAEIYGAKIKQIKEKYETVSGI